MPHITDSRTLTFQALRLKTFSVPEVSAPAVGLDPAVMAQELVALQGAGLAAFREGRITGWALTKAGREAGAAAVAADLKASGLEARVRPCYEAFLKLNHDMLQVCTDWQMRNEKTLNDHSDKKYDDGVIATLESIDAKVQPVAVELGALMVRFQAFAPRLTEALNKVKAGGVEWFTKPLIDSYHTVWFEMHEDLLVTLSIDRAKEGQ